MNFNVSQLGRFLKQKANKVVSDATGVNVMSEYNTARYTASSMGVDVNAIRSSSSGDKVLNVGGPKKSQDGVDAGSGGGGSGTVQLRPHAQPQLSEEHPQALLLTVEDFLSRRDSQALTPHGGAALLIHALLNYAQPGSRQVGEQMLVLCMWEELLVKGSTYKGYALDPHHLHLLAAQAAAPNDWAVRSYVAGSTPEHGYWIDPQQIGLRFQPQEAGVPPEATEAQVLLWSSGADAPRPITLRKNKKGFWKVADFAALLAPVRPPTAPVHTAADDL